MVHPYRGCTNNHYKGGTASSYNSIERSLLRAFSYSCTFKFAFYHHNEYSQLAHPHRDHPPHPPIKGQNMLSTVRHLKRRGTWVQHCQPQHQLSVWRVYVSTRLVVGHHWNLKIKITLPLRLYWVISCPVWRQSSDQVPFGPAICIRNLHKW